MNYKNKTKKEYNLKSENIMKELKINKIKNNKNGMLYSINGQ